MRVISLLLLACALLSTAVVRMPLHPSTVVLEAEGYAQITPPMRVAHGEAASGGAWIELPLGSGQGWRGRGNGDVIYRVETRNAGNYRVWIRALWGDGCTNALFLRVNESRPIVFGNDAVFKQWHWVKSLPLPLAAGTNQITLANHSDGVAFDKLIVTDDPQYVPEGVGEGISRFFDGFAGCDADNTGSWERVSGKWRVVKAIGDSASGANDCIAQWAPEGGIALTGYPAWKRYDMKASLMLSGPATAALIVGHIDASHEYRVLLDVQDGRARVALVQLNGGSPVTLAESTSIQGFYDHWYSLGFTRAEDEWRVMLDGAQVLTAKIGEEVRGQVGLATMDSGGVYFDNVDVQFNE